MYGVVDSDMEKHVAELRASGVSGVFSVENKLIVNRQGEQKLAEKR